MRDTIREYDPAVASLLPVSNAAARSMAKMEGGSALYLSNRRVGDWLGRYGVCVSGGDGDDGGGDVVSVSRDVRKGDVLHTTSIYFRKEPSTQREKDDSMYRYCFAIDRDADVKVDFLACPLSLAAFLTTSGYGYGSANKIAATRSNTFYRWSAKGTFNGLAEDGTPDEDFDIGKLTMSASIDLIASRDIKRGETIRFDIQENDTERQIFVLLCQLAYEKQQYDSIARVASRIH